MRDFSTPDYLDDIAPADALAIEHARSAALQHLFAHGYLPIVPPLVEYLETLTNGDEALNRETFKMTDTVSGRTLGIRADQTPQITRFDAARRGGNGGNSGDDNTDKNSDDTVRRYCYCGPTLLTHPPQPWQSREMMQLGAECFGADSPTADWEIAMLAFDVLTAAGVADIKLDLGHAGLFYALAADADADTQQQLLRAIATRNNRALHPLSENLHHRDALRRLTALHGDATCLADTENFLPPALTDELKFLYRQLQHPDRDVGINLSDLGSYNYHTGVVFTFYAANRIIGRGGRYQPAGGGTHAGGSPAVGFSINLRALPLPPPPPQPAPVAVPLVGDDANWREAVAQLQRAQTPIRFTAPDAPTAPPHLCRHNGKWRVQNK